MRRSKKSGKENFHTRVVTLAEQRASLEKTDWQTYLRFSGVTNNEQMQLMVLFRLLHSLCYEDAHRRNDVDAKTSLNHQMAVFEKAMEEESKFLKKIGLQMP